MVDYLNSNLKKKNYFAKSLSNDTILVINLLQNYHCSVVFAGPKIPMKFDKSSGCAEEREAHMDIRTNLTGINIDGSIKKIKK